MPFQIRSTWVPTLGKGPELRALLEERLKARNSQGFPTGLSAQLFGADGQAFVLYGTAPDLAAYESYMRQRDPDPAYRAHQNKVSQLLSQPTTLQIFDGLLALAPTVSEPSKFSQRVTYYPAFGKGPELRSALEARVKDRQAHGLRSGLQAQLFGPVGTAYVSGTVFPSLAAYEQYRSDPGLAAFQAKIAPLVSAAGKSQFFEILVNAPRQ
ncbi:MAG: hypothetical protein EXR50_03925 [Dehalococcoidia bacterium]|nr:hypothetical protein [Dehalococcoidia bacterium]